MSTPVLTLGPEVLQQSGEPSVWEGALIAFVREAGQSGKTVLVSTEAKLLSPEDAARRLMVSRSTISRRIADGEIQAVKVGNRHRIPYSEVQRVWQESMTAMAKVVASDIEAELFGDSHLTAM
jgi:excisionase family DNA binding protein